MFRKLVSVEEAQKLLDQNFTPKPLGIETVSLSEAHGRVLAVDIVSPFDVPPFDRSTVDGYAVKADDTFSADEDRPVSLEFCGKVNVGEIPKIRVKRGMAAEIVTGAPIPEGADAAVMMEDTVRNGDTILVHTSVSKAENVMRAGSDIHKGQTVLKKSVLLSSGEIGILAAVGAAKVKVYKRPKVAVISTGAEIVEPGKRLPPRKIYDINAHTLSAAVVECGGEPLIMGIIQDKANQMKSALNEALTVADMVITSGGVSVGPTDLIPKVLDTLGKPGVIVYGIAIKPGKPTTMAIINGKPVFSLPGHPTSSLLTFHLFVKPVLAKMAGKPEEKPITVKAVTSEKFFSARGRRTCVTITLKRDKTGKTVAYPVPTDASGAITTLSKADGFIEIHESQQFVDAGETVTVYLFKPEIYYSLMS